MGAVHFDDASNAGRIETISYINSSNMNRKTWKECVDDDMNVLGLHPEWAVFRDMWRDFIWANVNPSIAFSNK